MKDLRRETFQDKTFICVDCGATFTFTAGEQLYFASKDMAIPKRCKVCRDRRRLTLVTREMEARNGLD